MTYGLNILSLISPVLTIIIRKKYFPGELRQSNNYTWLCKKGIRNDELNLDRSCPCTSERTCVSKCFSWDWLSLCSSCSDVIVSNRFKRARTVHDKERCPNDIRHLPKPRGTYDKSYYWLLLFLHTYSQFFIREQAEGLDRLAWITCGGTAKAFTV